MDIVPFPSYAGNSEFHEQLASEGKKDLALEEDWGWCLFSVEVRNAYGLPFDVTFSRLEDGMLVRGKGILNVLIPVRRHNCFDDDDNSTRVDVQVGLAFYS